MYYFVYVMEMFQNKIILFDGVCNLCNDAVKFVIKRDKKGVFKFASLQSDIGKNLCSERHIDINAIDSIVLIDPGKAYYIKSEAAFEIAKELKGWGWLQILGWGLPRGLCDAIYDLIARNRYSWFGKQPTCMLPTPEQLNRFL